MPSSVGTGPPPARVYLDAGGQRYILCPSCDSIMLACTCGIYADGSRLHCEQCGWVQELVPSPVGTLGGLHPDVEAPVPGASLPRPVINCTSCRQPVSGSLEDLRRAGNAPLLSYPTRIYCDSCMAPCQVSGCTTGGNGTARHRGTDLIPISMDIARSQPAMRVCTQHLSIMRTEPIPPWNCYNCGHYYTAGIECRIVDHGDGPLTYCAHCTSERGVILCDNTRRPCGPNVYHEERCPYRANRQRPYSWRPGPTDHLLAEGEKAAPFFLGVELEVECRGTLDPDDVGTLAGDTDFLYSKGDGSLDNGIEMVSYPLSLEYLNGKREVLGALFDKLRKKGVRSFSTSTCGMHIHISKTAVERTLHLFRLLKLVYDNGGFTLLVSQRNPALLERWSSITDNRRAAIYARAKRKWNDHGVRYTAVNLENAGTIEFRIFRGTLRVETFFKNVQYVVAACAFTREISLRDVTAQKFVQYVMEHEKEYPDLVKWLKEHELTAENLPARTAKAAGHLKQAAAAAGENTEDFPEYEQELDGETRLTSSRYRYDDDDDTSF